MGAVKESLSFTRDLMSLERFAIAIAGEENEDKILQLTKHIDDFDKLIEALEKLEKTLEFVQNTSEFTLENSGILNILGRTTETIRYWAC